MVYCPPSAFILPNFSDVPSVFPSNPRPNSTLTTTLPTERFGEKAVFAPVNRKLLRKLKKGKRVVSGSQVIRARICEDCPPDSSGIHVLPLLFAVCCLWVAIKAHAVPGRRLLPASKGKKGLSALRGFARVRARSGFERPWKYPFRRGAAR